jgi:hypothetical protein
MLRFVLTRNPDSCTEQVSEMNCSILNISPVNGEQIHDTNVALM